MSALGQMRSFAPDQPNVRFAPIADIRHQRFAVAIHNRPGLERRACECYAISKWEFDRLLGSKARRRRATKDCLMPSWAPDVSLFRVPRV